MTSDISIFYFIILFLCVYMSPGAEGGIRSPETRVRGSYEMFGSSRRRASDFNI